MRLSIIKKPNKANTADRLKRHFFAKKPQKNCPFKRPLIWSLALQRDRHGNKF